MNYNDFGNLYKGIGVIVAEMVLVLIALSSVSYYSGAGTEAYYIGMLFVFSQVLVIVVAYICWYRRVNRFVAEMYNIEEKRKKAIEYIPQYLILSAFISGLITVIAILAIIFGLLFSGISTIYCYSSVLSEYIIGNITLFIIMRWFGMPNRVVY